MKNETELLIDDLKKDLKLAKKDKSIDWESKSFGYEEGYLISYKELELIVNYIKNLRVASGRKP